MAEEKKKKKKSLSVKLTKRPSWDAKLAGNGHMPTRAEEEEECGGGWCQN